MKANRKQLLNELKFVARAAERSSTVPILEHVLWSFDGQKLNLAATDTQVTLQSSLALETAAVNSRALAVPAVSSIALLSEMFGDEVEIECEGGRWLVRDDRSRVRLSGLPPEQFPGQPDMDSARSWEVNAARLQEATALTVHAGANADNKVGPGFALVPGGPEGGLTIGATDGHRMAVSGGDVGDLIEGDSPEAVIRIPTPVLRILEGFPAAGKSEVWAIDRDEHRVRLTAGARSLSFRPSELAFPRLDNVLRRAKGPHSITADRREFLAAARAASACPGLDGAVAMEIGGEGGGLEIQAVTAVSEVRVEVQARIEGPNLRMGVSPAYLADLLASIPGKEATIWYETENHPLYYELLGDPVSEWRVTAQMMLPKT